MATYVLVHGSWHGAWCWENIIPSLEQKGHTVFAPDLPGHGQDKTPLKKITLQSYVDCIKAVLDQAKEPVILVGHSMAGMIISQVAENWPETIKSLVYVTAFIPQNGECLSDIVRKQPFSEHSRAIYSVAEEAALYFPLEHMREFGYNRCDPQLLARLSPLFCVEPLRPYFDKVKLTSERFGQIPRAYIACLADQAVWHSSQMRMVNETPCQVYTLDCDHSPFYSVPNELAGTLLSVYADDQGFI